MLFVLDLIYSFFLIVTFFFFFLISLLFFLALFFFYLTEAIVLSSDDEEVDDSLVHDLETNIASQYSGLFSWRGGWMVNQN